MPGFELINNLEKKAVNKIFSEGAVFFAHGFNKLRKRFHVREFETISKKKNEIKIFTSSYQRNLSYSNCIKGIGN